MKNIVIYYSKGGNNRFIAHKIAGHLHCHIEEIKPRCNARFFLLFGLHFGNKKLKADLSSYEQVILCGPVWMGKFIAPLKSFVKTHQNNIKRLIFVTCCGSSFEDKDKKFGHGLVFQEVKNQLQDKCVRCEAFPISMLLSESEKQDPKAVMNARLTRENFGGEMEKQLNHFLLDISVANHAD